MYNQTAENLLGSNQAGLCPDGVLASQYIEKFIAEGIIKAKEPVFPEQIQPASMDLRLGGIAYRVRAGFLPGNSSTVMARVEDLKMHEVDLTNQGALEKGAVYIIPLLEGVDLPEDVACIASPKSSTGRLDILTRLITDYGTSFDRVPSGHKGGLYLEVTPLTFSIIAKKGDKLTQLRLRKGGCKVLNDIELKQLDDSEQLVFLKNGGQEAANIADGLWMSVDLEGKKSDGIIGYRARKNSPLVDLNKIGHYDIQEFWEPIYRPKSGDLVLDPEEFYIMASREHLKVPIGYSAEMMAYETTAGELRVHYAGFFDPGFGCVKEGEKQGTTGVLEIRSHDVPFVLEHGQKICRMVYEKVNEVPEKVYGVSIKSNYSGQSLKLAKQFVMNK